MLWRSTKKKTIVILSEVRANEGARTKSKDPDDGAYDHTAGDFFTRTIKFVSAASAAADNRHDL
jgi:hypothetical protein